MGLFLQDKTNDTQWAVWKVEESLEALLALLPDARRVCCIFLGKVTNLIHRSYVAVHREHAVCDDNAENRSTIQW